MRKRGRCFALLQATRHLHATEQKPTSISMEIGIEFMRLCLNKKLLTNSNAECFSQ